MSSLKLIGFNPTRREKEKETNKSISSTNRKKNFYVLAIINKETYNEFSTNSEIKRITIFIDFIYLFFHLH